MTYELALMEREERGEERGVEKVALNLLNMGMTFEKIQEATKLPLKRIEELSKFVVSGKFLQ